MNFNDGMEEGVAGQAPAAGPAAGGAVWGAVRRGAGRAEPLRLRLRLPLKERERDELYFERRPECDGGPRRLCGRPSLGVSTGDLRPPLTQLLKARHTAIPCAQFKCPAQV